MAKIGVAHGDAASAKTAPAMYACTKGGTETDFGSKFAPNDGKVNSKTSNRFKPIAIANAAAAVGAHGMLSIVGLDDATLEKIVSDALQKVKSGGGGDADDVVCEITNFLFPQGRVVSGDKSALEVVQEAAQAAGAIKVATLAVSGAFHTSRMESASRKLREALDQATFNKPRVSAMAGRS